MAGVKTALRDLARRWTALDAEIKTLNKQIEVAPAATLDVLRSQLDTFRQLYNQQRPHRELGRRTPATTPTQPAQSRTRRPRAPLAIPASLRPPRHPRQDELPTSACTTSASAPSTHANASWPSQTTPPSPSSHSTPPRSSPPPDPAREVLLAQHSKSPGPMARGFEMRPMSRLKLSETHVATHHRVELRGIRTPDLLLARDAPMFRRISEDLLEACPDLQS